MVRRVDWDPDLVMQLLVTRSFGLCEGRTVACLAPAGQLDALPRYRVSIQHRLSRGMGGTRRPDVHDMQDLLVLCGDGTTGCHGWVEGRRPGMKERGLWRPHSTAERDSPGGENGPETHPVMLASGHIVRLGMFYEHVGWHFGAIPGEPVGHVGAGLAHTENLCSLG